MYEKGNMDNHDDYRSRFNVKNPKKKLIPKGLPGNTAFENGKRIVNYAPRREAFCDTVEPRCDTRATLQSKTASRAINKIE